MHNNFDMTVGNFTFELFLVFIVFWSKTVHATQIEGSKLQCKGKCEDRNETCCMVLEDPESNGPSKNHVLDGVSPEWILPIVVSIVALCGLIGGVIYLIRMKHTRRQRRTRRRRRQTNEQVITFRHNTPSTVSQQQHDYTHLQGTASRETTNDGVNATSFRDDDYITPVSMPLSNDGCLFPVAMSSGSSGYLSPVTASYGDDGYLCPVDRRPCTMNQHDRLTSLILEHPCVDVYGRNEPVYLSLPSLHGESDPHWKQHNLVESGDQSFVLPHQRWRSIQHELRSGDEHSQQGHFIAGDTFIPRLTTHHHSYTTGIIGQLFGLECITRDANEIRTISSISQKKHGNSNVDVASRCVSSYQGHTGAKPSTDIHTILEGNSHADRHRPYLAGLTIKCRQLLDINDDNTSDSSDSSSEEDSRHPASKNHEYVIMDENDLKKPLCSKMRTKHLSSRLEGGELYVNMHGRPRQNKTNGQKVLSVSSPLAKSRYSVLPFPTSVAKSLYSKPSVHTALSNERISAADVDDGYASTGTHVPASVAQSRGSTDDAEYSSRPSSAVPISVATTDVKCNANVSSVSTQTLCREVESSSVSQDLNTDTRHIARSHRRHMTLIPRDVQYNYAEEL